MINEETIFDRQLRPIVEREIMSQPAEARHTKEPWHVGSQNDALYITAGKPPSKSNDYPDYDADRELIAKIFGSYPVSDANASRIAACVNACAGIPTDKLEKIAHCIGMRADVLMRQLAERDELLAIADGINARRRLRGFLVPEDAQDLLEAIAKAKP